MGPRCTQRSLPSAGAHSLLPLSPSGEGGDMRGHRWFGHLKGIEVLLKTFPDHSGLELEINREGKLEILQRDGSHTLSRHQLVKVEIKSESEGYLGAQWERAPILDFS